MKIVLEDGEGRELGVSYYYDDGQMDHVFVLDIGSRSLSFPMTKKNLDSLASAIQFLKVNVE